MGWPQRPDSGKLAQTPAFAPIGEAAGGAKVSAPCVIVIDVGGEETQRIVPRPLRGAGRKQGA